MAPSKDSKVVVIGAGFSGMTAAKALKEAGWTNLCIIEARDYVGGRVVTKQIGDSNSWVDAGAAWVHGKGTEEKVNPLLPFCDHYGVTYDEHPYLKGSPVIVDTTQDTNEILSQEEIEPMMGLLYTQIDKFSPTVSTKDTIKKILDGLEETKEVGSKARVRAEFGLEHMAAGASGHGDVQTLYWVVNGVTGKLHGKPDLLINGGYQSMYKHLADGLDIKLNKIVQGITKSESSIVISCDDGETISADYVICTVPLGVLKAGSIAFEPELSVSKVDAMSRVSMGNFEKVILVFEERFWDENFNGKLSFHIGGENRPFPSWFEISDKAGAPTWVCLYDGLFARKVQTEEFWSDEKIVKEARKAIAAVLQVDEDKLPACTASMCTHWARDPYSFGSYSYTRVGCKGLEDFDEIAKPEWNDTLLFAGEHTIGEYAASVHGPFESGLREARRLDPDAKIAGCNL